MRDNDWGITSFPLIAGHEVVGEVAAAGAGVAAFKVGGVRVVCMCVRGACSRVGLRCRKRQLVNHLSRVSDPCPPFLNNDNPREQTNLENPGRRPRRLRLAARVVPPVRLLPEGGREPVRQGGPDHRGT
jgi:hypothetical protein